MTLWQLGDRNGPKYKFLGHQDAYFDDAPAFGTDPGRFDPAVHRRQGMRTYLVARLDSIDVELAIELVDQALYGDAYVSPLAGFYGGTAYCDTRYSAYTARDLIDYP